MPTLAAAWHEKVPKWCKDKQVVSSEPLRFRSMALSMMIVLKFMLGPPGVCSSASD